MTKATAASKKKKKSSTTAAAKKKNKNKNDVTSHKSKETFVLCPYTDQKVWIGKATVKELKASSSSSSKTTNTIHKSGHKKRLWTISSSQIRYEHYDAVCQALSLYEQNLLPSSGGRSWEVSVTLSESNGRALFRSYKGRMEVRYNNITIVLLYVVAYSNTPSNKHCLLFFFPFLWFHFIS